MEAPVLTPAEQKAALSKKKKKRILKNVLDLPKYLKVKSTSVEDSETEKLKNILERLLPSARLPSQQNLKDKSTILEDTTVKETAQLKRKQLAIGVNDLNKSIKNGLISAALLASDIEPKFLVHHLNLLCVHNKIPYLHMVGLRAVTKECLGFPCIALGFRKNSDFSEVINEIETLYANSNKDENCKKSEADIVTNSEKVAEEVIDEQNDEPPVAYLYRSSKKERVFVPENHISGKKIDGFIPFDKGADVKPKDMVSDTKFPLVKKESKEKSTVKEDSSSEENFEVPRKKLKKSWVVDSGKKEEFRYHAVNLVKMSSNPYRAGKKRKI